MTPYYDNDEIYAELKRTYDEIGEILGSFSDRHLNCGPWEINYCCLFDDLKELPERLRPLVADLDRLEEELSYDGQTQPDPDLAVDDPIFWGEEG